MPVISKELQRENYRAMRRVRRHVSNMILNYCARHRLTDYRFAARTGLSVDVIRRLRQDKYEMSLLDLWTFATLLDTTPLQILITVEARERMKPDKKNETAD